MAVAAADIVSRNPSLLIGRTGQCDPGILSGDPVTDLHGIARCVDIRNGSFHAAVHNNTASRA